MTATCDWVAEGDCSPGRISVLLIDDDAVCCCRRHYNRYARPSKRAKSA